MMIHSKRLYQVCYVSGTDLVTRDLSVNDVEKKRFQNGHRQLQIKYLQNKVIKILLKLIQQKVT